MPICVYVIQALKMPSDIDETSEKKRNKRCILDSRGASRSSSSLEKTKFGVGLRSWIDLGENSSSAGSFAEEGASKENEDSACVG